MTFAPAIATILPHRSKGTTTNSILPTSNPTREKLLSSMPARKPYSIAAVTVTFNGARVVRHHLQSLKRQTRPMDEIVVVDNASSDDTHHLLATEFPEITVLRMTRNIGVGGGFAAGLSY